MREEVVILGCGGHASVIIEILEEAGEYSIRGCTAADHPTAGFLGYPVLGSDSVLPAIRGAGVRHAFVAVGNNRVRSQLCRLAGDSGFHLIRAVSRRAVVSPRAVLGDGVAVMAGAVLNSRCCIGRGAIINTAASVDHDCSIGEFAHVCPGVHLAGNVRVGDGALIGTGASVIPGIRIGEWSVIGAGAAVIRDVPPYSTVVGVPARALPGGLRRGPGELK